MNDEASRFRQRIACISDSSRFEIVLLLSAGDLCVSAVARRIGRSQSCTTRHLQALQRLGLVRGRRDGKQVLFEVCATEPEIRMVIEAAGAGVSAGPASWVGAAAPLDTAAAGARRPAKRSGEAVRPKQTRPAAIPASDQVGRLDEGLAADVASDLDAPTQVASDREWSDDAERARPAVAPRRHDLEDYLL
jgi:DNA-binding transcriptional ArsR family regulator